MKKIVVMTFAALAMLMAACGNKTTQGTGENGQEATVPDGYKTYEGKGFSVSCPQEAVKNEQWSNEDVFQFNSDAKVKHSDGQEYTSSFRMNITYQDSGAADIKELAEYAKNLKYLQEKQMDYKCDEPKVEGDLMTMRGTRDETITTFFSRLGKGGKAATGSISYVKEDAHVYDKEVMPIIKSIKFK